MTQEEILKFQKRARYVARKKGYPDLAEDFAQEVILAYLSNPDRRSTVDQLFIDYLRGTYGDTRSTCGAARSQAELNLCSLDDQRNLAQDSEPQREYGKCAFLFRGKQAELYQAYFLDELTESAIGDQMGVSESRICQMLKPMKNQIEEYFILQEFEDRLRDEKERLALFVDWIRL